MNQPPTITTRPDIANLESLFENVMPGNWVKSPKSMDTVISRSNLAKEFMTAEMAGNVDKFFDDHIKAYGGALVGESMPESAVEFVCTAHNELPGVIQYIKLLESFLGWTREELRIINKKSLRTAGLRIELLENIIHNTIHELGIDTDLNPCGICGGTGLVPVDVSRNEDRIGQILQSCKPCEGTGWVDKKEFCKLCGDKQYVEVVRIDGQPTVKHCMNCNSPIRKVEIND